MKPISFLSLKILSKNFLTIFYINILTLSILNLFSLLLKTKNLAFNKLLSLILLQSITYGLNTCKVTKQLFISKVQLLILKVLKQLQVFLYILGLLKHSTSIWSRLFSVNFSLKKKNKTMIIMKKTQCKCLKNMQIKMMTNKLVMNIMVPKESIMHSFMTVLSIHLKTGSCLFKNQ